MGDTAETATVHVTNIINGLNRDKKDGTLNHNFRILLAAV